MARATLAHAEKIAALLPPLLVEAEHVAASVWQGTHGRRRAGRGESFWQYRPYDAGDPAERIDWRQSARTDKVYVRLREWEASQNVCLWADASGSMHYASGGTPTKSDRARVLMLALASLLLRGGEKVLWSRQSQFVPVHGKAGLEEVAVESPPTQPSPQGGRAMHRPDGNIDPQDGNDSFQKDKRNSLPPWGEGWGGGSIRDESFPPLPPKARHAHMILASDFLMPGEVLKERMQAYAAQNLHGVLVHIVDPLEASFDLDGRVELRGAEGESPLLVPSAKTLRDAYREKFAAHQARLRHLAQSAGWFYLRHITDRPAQEALMWLYQYLGG